MGHSARVTWVRLYSVAEALFHILYNIISVASVVVLIHSLMSVSLER